MWKSEIGLRVTLVCSKDPKNRHMWERWGKNPLWLFPFSAAQILLPRSYLGKFPGFYVFVCRERDKVIIFNIRIQFVRHHETFFQQFQRILRVLQKYSHPLNCFVSLL